MSEESTVEAGINRTLPEIYFDETRLAYWYEVNGNWVRATEAHALQHLHENGVANTRMKLVNKGGDAEPARKAAPAVYTPAQVALKGVRENKSVIYAGAVAGSELGLHDVGDGKYLVVAKPRLPEPVAGEWADIRILGERLFGEEQLPYIWAWHKGAAENLYLGRKNFSQALILAGGPGCGKSFWQMNLTTPLLGGRVARPIQYMTGQTSFNGDLIGCEHLMLEDENAKTDHPSRRSLGTALKGFTANSMQRVHAKGKEGFTVASRHWVTMSINDEDENMHVLPPLDDSMREKLILILCNQAINNEWPGPNGAVRDMEARVRSQIPAWTHWLLNEYVIPDALQDYRYGVKSYLNPELLSRIDTGERELELDELIEDCWDQLAQAQTSKTEVITTANQLLDNLITSPNSSFRARSLLNWNNATGRYLGRLSKRFPERYTERRTKGARLWRIVRRTS